MANAAPNSSRCCSRARNKRYARWSGDRATAACSNVRRGKSGLHGMKVPGNARRSAIALAKADQGKCHRKHTAGLRVGKVERVRQERTARLATEAARQTPPGARPNRGGIWGIPPRHPGWSLERRGNPPPRGMVAQASRWSNGGALDRTRLTGPLTAFLLIVIASEARQSSQTKTLDCFAALAMTPTKA